MKILKLKWLFILSVLFALYSSAFAKTIVIKGSTTILPIVQRAAEEYMHIHPDLNISVSGGGSGQGIKALLDKTTDIASSSRFVKQNEIKLAYKKGILLVPHWIAIDAVVPIVNPIPISRELFLFTNGWPKGDVKSFIHFLITPSGQKIVEEEKYIPLY